MPLNFPLVRRWLVGAGIVFVSLLLFREQLFDATGLRARHHKHLDHDGFASHRQMLSVVREWQKKEGIRKIVGLVFYGKRQEASILDCYLKVRFVFAAVDLPQCQDELISSHYLLIDTNLICRTAQPC